MGEVNLAVSVTIQFRSSGQEIPTREPGKAHQAHTHFYLDVDNRMELAALRFRSGQAKTERFVSKQNLKSVFHLWPQSSYIRQIITRQL